MFIVKKSLKNKIAALVSKGNLLLIFAILIVILAAAVLFNVRKLSVLDLKYGLENLGGFSYVVFLILCILRSILFLPCGLFSALGGMLFGPVKGVAVTLVGLTTGSLINFYLARLLGKEWAERFARGKLANIEKAISGSGFPSIMLLRLTPIFPFDAVSCVGGLTKVKVRDYIAGTFVGSIPGVFVYTYLGDLVKIFSYKKIIVSLAIIAFITLFPFLCNYIIKRKSDGKGIKP